MLLRVTFYAAVSTAISSTGVAVAQYAPVDPMPLGQLSTSTMANKLSGDIASGKSASSAQSSRCFVDPDARFLFVSPAETMTAAAQQQAEPFDLERFSGDLNRGEFTRRAFSD